jgi:transposase-like protein
MATSGFWILTSSPPKILCCIYVVSTTKILLKRHNAYHKGANEMRKINLPKYYPSKYKTKAEAVLDMLKGGETVKQIKDRMAVSDSYIYSMKKQLEKLMKEGAFTPKEVGVSEETFAEVAHQVSQGKGRDKPTPKPEPEVSGVDKVLDTRAEQYGSFMQSADTVIRIKGIMHNAIARNEVHLYPDQLQALDMIATKISRIVHGNPNHLDSWIDIAGYAKLVADRLQGTVR